MNVFEIEKLGFTFRNKDSHNKVTNNHVLFIDSLKIKKGKFTVILGNSGCGKSTLIEAMGLMNDTIHEGDVIYKSPERPENLGKLWCNRGKMAQIRRDYFSFIFQDDYLMPYYTCEENALIARLIQNKIEKQLCAGLLKEPVDSIQLKDDKTDPVEDGKLKEPADTLKPKDEINELMKRHPVKISGGQKQKLSFIRAILKDFDVLFGDEPTGNLDFANSLKLFEFIKEKLNGNGKDSSAISKPTERGRENSAIIVSHNIELTVAMADNIIVLTKSAPGSKFNYELKPGHVFERDRHDVARWDGFTDNDALVSFIKTIMSVQPVQSS